MVEIMVIGNNCIARANTALRMIVRREASENEKRPCTLLSRLMFICVRCLDLLRENYLIIVH